MSYQIDGSVGVDSSWRGNMYTVQYKVQAESKNLFDQFVPYGSNATNLPGRPISVPCYVYKCGTKFVKPHWFYTFQICDNNYAWDLTYIPQNINQIIKEYGLGEITMQPEWFGIRLATREDAGYNSQTGEFDKPQIKNIFGNYCNIGDWLYKDATTSDKGSMDDSTCPFVIIYSELSSLMLSQLATNLKVVTYRVTYSSLTNIEWKGINGQWGAGCAPNDIRSGVWKAVDSKSQNYFQGGANKWRTTRTVMKAPVFGPDQLVWKTDVNGGVWTW